MSPRAPIEGTPAGSLQWGAVVIGRRVDGYWPGEPVVGTWEPDFDEDGLPWKVTRTPGEYDFVDVRDFQVTEVLFEGVTTWPV
jgi:hypothetical protein